MSHGISYDTIVSIYDKNGKKEKEVTQQSSTEFKSKIYLNDQEHEFDSFVAQFSKILYSRWSESGWMDIAGRFYGSNSQIYGVARSSGPHVGTGNTAVTNDNYNFNQIGYGTAEGELSPVGLATAESIVATADEISFVVSRAFMNQTEAPITVNEIALCFHAYYNLVMIARDVLPEPTIINPLNQINIKYKLSTSFTADGGLTKNFLLSLFEMFGDPGFQTLYFQGYRKGVANIEDDTKGITVGSGANPFTPDDTALHQKIDHGNGVGQLQYGDGLHANSLHKAPYIVGNICQMDLGRRFLNESDAPIDVKEIGLTVKDISVSRLMLRTLVDVTVDPGKILDVRLRFKTSTEDIEA